MDKRTSVNPKKIGDTGSIIEKPSTQLGHGDEY
jgi:hypothetical protein